MFGEEIATMADVKYKYNLNHHINFLPAYWTAKAIAEEVEKYGIPSRTFYRDKSLKLTDRADITGERLLIYSRLFNCTIDQLINYNKKVKPLNETKFSVSMKKILERNNLKLPS